MSDIVIRKLWEEGKIEFFLHFHNGKVLRQIELAKHETKYLTAENSMHWASMMHDQSIKNFDYNEYYLITETELIRFGKNK